MSEQPLSRRIPCKQVCLVQLGGIGDVVHSMPSANALKREDPERRITWVTAPASAPLLQPHPGADRVIIFHRERRQRGVAALWRELRRYRFDVVINFGVYSKTAIPTFFARAPYKLGWGRDWARELTWLSANVHLPAPTRIPHTRDQQFEFIKRLGIPIEPIEWRITLTEQERKEQRQAFAEWGDRPVVGLVVTSGRKLKDWDVERFADLATVLDRDSGAKVLLLGGPSERERRRARDVMAKSDAQISCQLGPSLRRLVYLVDGCDLVIAPDTGPLHIAHALGTPVVGLFAHTDPLKDGPTDAYQDIWVDRYNFDGPQQTAARDGRQFEGRRMSLITVSDVVSAVERAMQRYVSKAGSGAPWRAPPRRL